MPDWYRDHDLSPECYPESEYLSWAQDHGLYVEAAGNVDYGPPARTNAHSCGCTVNSDGYIASECAAHRNFKLPDPSCPVCSDTGIVHCPEPDGTGLYETACTEPGCTAPYPPDGANFTGTGEEPY